MTPAHIFFIPTVFFLGVFVGGILATRVLGSDRRPQPMRGALPQREIWTLAIAVMVFAGIFAVTHQSPQFGGSKAISAAAHGMPLLDQRPSFSSGAVVERLAGFGVLGRAMYQRFTYSVDVIFPLSFLLVLFLLARFVDRRVAVQNIVRRGLGAMPFIWFGTDMLENAIVFTLLAQFPHQNHILAGLVGYVTVVKFCLLLMSIAAPAILIVGFRKDVVSRHSPA